MYGCWAGGWCSLFVELAITQSNSLVLFETVPNMNMVWLFRGGCVAALHACDMSHGVTLAGTHAVQQSHGVAVLATVGLISAIMGLLALAPGWPRLELLGAG